MLTLTKSLIKLLPYFVCFFFFSDIYFCHVVCSLIFSYLLISTFDYYKKKNYLTILLRYRHQSGKTTWISREGYVDFLLFQLQLLWSCVDECVYIYILFFFRTFMFISWFSSIKFASPYLAESLWLMQNNYSFQHSYPVKIFWFVIYLGVDLAYVRYC